MQEHHHPPSPPSTPDAAGNATLSALINTATRTYHTDLNRLITTRLPLSLPPHQTTPLVLSRGLVPFLRIILLFEQEWELLARHVEHNLSHPSSSPRYKDLPPQAALHAQELRTWITALRPEGLVRTPRIKSDLHHLHRVAGKHAYATVPLGDPWADRMRAQVRRKPHLFIAFAWVFYMAIFSGGRWIRARFASVGPEFWLEGRASLSPSPSPSSIARHDGASAERTTAKATESLPGFTFFSFDGEQDGEDVKAEFKARLLEAETLLSSEERREVVEMARELFQRNILLVGELDRMFLREKAVKAARAMAPSALGLFLLLGVLLAWFARR
jgi:heme oxygenase